MRVQSRVGSDKRIQKCKPEVGVQPTHGETLIVQICKTKVKRFHTVIFCPL